MKGDVGRPEVSKQTVAFLEDAQKEYSSRYHQEGPFMPVYNQEGWGWNGADPNTHWMGFQFRTFAHLANYYYLSGDEKAGEMCSKFMTWVNNNSKATEKGFQIPSAIYSGKADGEGHSHSGGPTGSVESTDYMPDAHGLYAQGLVMYAAKSKDPVIKARAEKILDDLKNRQAKDGSFPAEDGKVFGFHQSEVGIAFGLYQLYLENR